MDTELLVQLVKSEHFEWMPGMRYRYPCDIECGWAYDRVLDDGDRLDLRRDGSVLPVPDDPGTLGCLLRLARKVWRDRVYCAPAAFHWGMKMGNGVPLWRAADAPKEHKIGLHNTEAEAIAIAIIYAPPRKK